MTVLYRDMRNKIITETVTGIEIVFLCTIFLHGFYTQVYASPIVLHTDIHNTVITIYVKLNKNAESFLITKDNKVS